MLTTSPKYSPLLRLLGPTRLAVLTAVISIGQAFAATVNYVGAEISTASAGDWGVNNAEFRSTGTDPKAYVTGSVNAYGTDGTIFFDAGVDLPSYVSGYSTGSGSNYFNPGGPGGFLTISDPTAAIAPSVSNIYAGLLLFSGSGDIMSFTASTSSSFRVGIVLGSNGDNLKPIQLTLSLNGSPSVFATVVPSGQNGADMPDWYFFDINNAVLGNVFSISVVNNPSAYGGRTSIAGVTFDTLPVPEPSAAILMSLAFGGMMFVRSFRRLKGVASK